MTEDELMEGIRAAFGYASSRWRMHHDGRADLAQTWGSPGFPDVVAVGCANDTAGVLLVIEAKTDTGRYRPGQEDWLRSFALVQGAVVLTATPAMYDGLIARILGPMLLRTYGNRPGMSAGYPLAATPAPRRGRPRRAGGRQW